MLVQQKRNGHRMLAETPERGKLQGLEVNERTTLNQ
jgi:hypothetical protein